MPVTAEATGARTAQEELQLLVFRLRGEEFAVRLTDAREIVKTMALTAVPSAPPAVRGILNLRGKVVTVVDLAALLGFPAAQEEAAHIIVADRDQEIVGILVHEVTGVLRVPASMLKATPAFLESKVQAAHVRGALVFEQKEKTASNAADAPAKTRLILVLDLPAVLSGLTTHSTFPPQV